MRESSNSSAISAAARRTRSLPPLKRDSLQADLLRARARRREREADLAERRSERRMAQAAWNVLV